MIIINADLFTQQAEITLATGERMYADFKSLPADLVNLAYSANDFKLIIMKNFPEEIYTSLIEHIARIEANRFNTSKIEIQGV